MTIVKQDSVDISIIGGGVVGGLAALMLAKARPELRLCVVDASDPEQRDPRTLALAHTTLLTLQRAGLDVTTLADEFANIQHIHVSDRGAVGSTTLHSQDYAIPSLGKVVSAQQLLDAIWQACEACPNIVWHRDTRTQSLQYQASSVAVQAQPQAQSQVNDPAAPFVWQTKFLIAADGGRSFVREHLAIERQHYDYQQVALIANVRVHQDHQGWAYERFTEQGPIALLPRAKREFALVWCVQQSAADSFKALTDDDFLAQLQQAFGFRAGQFVGIEDRASYPLHLLLANRAVYHRTALIGNACHTLHPIAGQGYNLGVRDVADLVDMLTQHWHPEQGVPHRALLAYEQQRQHDYQRIGGLTDGLVRVFSNQYPPLMVLRSVGLLTLRKHHTLSYPLARAAMGFRNLFGEA